MARTKKRKYRARYAVPNKDALVAQGYNQYQLSRIKKIIKAYSDDQALTLAHLQAPSTQIYKYKVGSGFTLGGAYDYKVVSYKLESLVEIIERVVPV